VNVNDPLTPHTHDDDESMHHHDEQAGYVATGPDAGRHVHDDDESLHHDEDGFEYAAAGEDARGDRIVDEAIAAAEASGDRPVDQLRNLVAWLVDQLVDEPENVHIEAIERGSAVQIQVRLPEAELGKVIGRGGRIAKSMRTALMIVGSRHHLRVSLDIEGKP
jgi:predicted RNA-binding protein YlqC (UPF0109 family)